MPNAFDASASDHVRQEAKEVRARLNKLEPDQPDFEQLLRKYIKAAQEHIAFEESRAWPPLRSALTGQEAVELSGADQRRANSGRDLARPRPAHRRAVHSAHGPADRSRVADAQQYRDDHETHDDRDERDRTHPGGRHATQPRPPTALPSL